MKNLSDHRTKGKDPLTVDPARLRRALELTDQALGGGQYRVTGGAEPHIVHYVPPAVWWCDCADNAIRHVTCKHLLRVALRHVDQPILEALRCLTATQAHRRGSS